MSSGASRYLVMRKIDLNAARFLFPAVLIGVILGPVLFVHAPRSTLRLVVGLVVGGIAISQLYYAGLKHYGAAQTADLAALRRRTWIATVAGTFSACTGTGVAEMHQPLLEHNATAILIEAAADWIITITNLTLGNLRLDILVFSVTGVVIGAQLGALWSPRLPDRLLKCTFAVSVLSIGTVYVTTSLAAL